MKIQKISLYPIAVPRKSGIVSHHAIVEIIADNELSGIGEMSDFGHLPMYVPDMRDLQKQLNVRLAGLDPMQREKISSLLKEMYPEQMYIYDMGSVIRCGIDIALHDLIAKHLGISVTDLVGGRCRNALEVCYPIFRLTDAKEIPATLDTVAQRMEEGITLFRYYFGRNFSVDEQLLTQLREKFGNRIRLKSLDASNILKPKEAIRAILRFQEFDFSIVESPCHRYDFEGTAEVRRSIPQPVSEHIFSEHQAMSLIRQNSVDIFNVALTFIGGILPAMKMFALAESAGLSCLVGTTQELSIGTAAQAQVGAVVASLGFPGDASGPRVYKTDVVKESVSYQGNMLMVPEGPGLGMTLDPGKLDAASTSLSIATGSVIGTLDRTPQ